MRGGLSTCLTGFAGGRLREGVERSVPGLEAMLIFFYFFVFTLHTQTRHRDGKSGVGRSSGQGTMPGVNDARPSQHAKTPKV